MFGFGSRQKFQMAQMALQEALTQLENTMRERDALNSSMLPLANVIWRLPKLSD
jgi:hypothetical protein